MKTKEEVFPIFQAFHTMIQNQFSAKIQVLRSDNGGEFVNQRFKAFFQQQGLLHETSCAQTPQQNGVAERKNRHILETTRALLLGTNVPTHHWDDAISAAEYLLNKMPSKVLHFKTPLQVLSSHVALPTVLLLPPRVFGCVVFVHLYKNQRSKLDPCAVKCLFLGYGPTKKGYKCFDPINKRLYITMDATFIESEHFYSPTVPNSALQGECKREELNELNWYLTAPATVSTTDNSTNPAATSIGDSPAQAGERELEEAENDVEGIHENQLKETENDVEGIHENRLNGELVNQESQPTPLSAVPESPIENNLEVSSSTVPPYNSDLNTPIEYVLPFRHNRGKPPNRYSPDTEERRSKFPIANYVSTQHLPDPIQSFTEVLSSCHTPDNIADALADPKWAQAIQ